MKNSPRPAPLLLLCTLAGTSAACAQIKFDGSMGSAEPFSGNEIAVDRGQKSGVNLFHSFSQFNVGASDSISFVVPCGVSNVISRVTGGEVSHIDGVLTTSRTAHLYLINPSGVIIGENASLNLGGSFTATTADYLLFKDANGVEVGRFWAASGKDVSLLVSPPAAFGFMDKQKGDSGQVTLNNAFAEGGDVAIVARSVLASGSNLSCGSLQVAAVGDAARQVDLRDSRPLVPNRCGTISMTNTTITSSGTGGIVVRSAGDISFTNASLSQPPAGKGNIVVESAGSIGFDSSFLQHSGSGAITLKAGKDLSVEAGTIKTHGNLTVKSGGSILINGGTLGTDAEGTAEGGDILVCSKGDIKIIKLGNIYSTNTGTGTGGDIVIRSGGDLSIIGGAPGASALIQSTTQGNGAGGNIDVCATGSLLLDEGGAVSSVSKGDGQGGKVTVAARSLGIRAGMSQLLTGIFSDARGRGNGGDIHVTIAKAISIDDLGQITASTGRKRLPTEPLILDTGKTGSIEVSAASLRITGTDESIHPPESDTRPNRIVTGISVKGSQNSSGKLGDLSVDIKGDIFLYRGGLIDATGFSFSNEANAGNVTVKAKTIHADRAGSHYFTGIGSGTEADVSLAGGKGGNIQVTADSICLLNGAQIAASTRSAGDAGSIIVNTRELTAAGKGDLTAVVFSEASGVVASAERFSAGTAGSVTINLLQGSFGTPPRIHLDDGSEIAARTVGSGSAGDVTLNWSSGVIRASRGAAITAESGPSGGNAGVVTIDARSIDLSNGGLITSSSQGQDSEAGGIALNLAAGMRAVGGTVEVSSELGSAGGIVIHGGRLLDFRRGALVAEALTSGGTITVSGADTLVFSDSLVSANARVERGGNINFEVARYLPGNTIPTVSSVLGADGEVQIEAVEVLAENTGELDVAPLDVSDSLQPECTQRLPSEAGSFIRSGRGGTRRLPGGYIPSLRLVKTAD